MNFPFASLLIGCLGMAIWFLLTLSRVRQWQQEPQKTSAKALTTTINIAIWTLLLINGIVPLVRPPWIPASFDHTVKTVTFILTGVYVLFWGVLLLWFHMTGHHARTNRASSSPKEPPI